MCDDDVCVMMCDDDDDVCVCVSWWCVLVLMASGWLSPPLQGNSSVLVIIVGLIGCQL